MIPTRKGGYQASDGPKGPQVSLGSARRDPARSERENRGRDQGVRRRRAGDVSGDSASCT
jgi:hypothetical protein